MDHFERLLEMRLNRMLDPIVLAPPPVRRRGSGPRLQARLRTLAGGVKEPSDGILLAEPVPIPIPVAVAGTPAS